MFQEQNAKSLAEQLQTKLDDQSGELVSLRRKNQNSQQEKVNIVCLYKLCDLVSVECMTLITVSI